MTWFSHLLKCISPRWFRIVVVRERVEMRIILIPQAGEIRSTDHAICTLIGGHQSHLDCDLWLHGPHLVATALAR